MKAAFRLVAVSLLSTLVLFGLALGRAQASPPDPTPVPPVTLDSAQCLVCHSRPRLTMQLYNGDLLYLAIDGTAYAAAPHGQAAMACTDCHTTLTTYPHPALEAQNLRELAAQFSASCQTCHPSHFAKQQDSVHQQALARGNENAAVCSDCHNPHTTATPAAPRSTIVATCGKCHSTVAQDYSQSVHGAALLEEDNPDVPSCIDCHGVHNIANPVRPQFLLNSPQLCAHCHTDPEKMAPYDLSTDVLNTYVADFHGTTITLFAKESPDQLTNKPLCIDCHGMHAIQSIKDPNSPVIKNNLLATCRQCHPSAEANFSGAWLSHYAPTMQHAPLVFWAGAIYKVMIPVVIGAMALFVVADASRRFIQPGRGARR